MTCMGDSLGNQMGVPAARKWIQHTAKLCDKLSRSWQEEKILR